MIGAIVGDVIGSVYEFANHRSTDFPLFGPQSRFTDDTVLTVAVAECLLHQAELVDAFHRYYTRYPGAGWGGMFNLWAAQRRREPYGSYGNGSAMRASPTGWAFDSEAETLAAAEWSARVTHDHPTGIAGAQAVALAIWMGRQHADKDEIVDEVAGRFGFRPTADVATLQRTNKFDETCQGTLPVVLQVFRESGSFEHAMRLGVSVGGDTDTICSITGAIAEAYYGKVPTLVADEALRRLDGPLLQVTETFCSRFVQTGSDRRV